MVIHYYQFYGFRLASQIELKELAVDSVQNDKEIIEINWGKVVPPEEGLKDAIYKPDSVAHRDFYYLNVAGIAHYYVEGKNKITIERQFDGSNRDIIAFLLDTVLSVVLIKNNKFIFHASAVTSSNSAIMLCGGSGIGKSALALKLLGAGFRFLEDDRCMLSYSTEEGKVYTQNYTTYIDYWKNNQQLVKAIQAANYLGPVRKNIQKYRVDVSNYVSADKFPIKKILILQSENAARESEAKELTGIAKFKVIKRLSHLNHLIPHIAEPNQYFKEVTQLLSSVPVYRIIRSSDTSIDDFTPFILEQLNLN